MSLIKLTLPVLFAPLLQAAIISVTPQPGTVLEPGQYIQLEFDPPLEQEEFNLIQSGTPFSLRDEARGKLLWTAAPIGGAPYESIFLIPQGEWSASAWVRLESRVDSSLAVPVTLENTHFTWPLVCLDCEWIGMEDAWPYAVSGPGSEAIELFPLDLNRDRLLDLALPRLELMDFLGIDSCASDLNTYGLGGQPLADFSQQRRLSAITLGTNPSGNLHPGSGLLLMSSGQEDNLLLLARTGSNFVPQFQTEQLAEGDYAGLPEVALPLRMQPDLLCQDLLVATRGGDLVHFLASEDCAGLSDSTVVLQSGLGLPLDMALRQGNSLMGLEDLLVLLDESPEPVSFHRWDGQSLERVFNADPAFTSNLQRLNEWSDLDAASLPDVIAWSDAGDVLAIANIDLANERADYSRWQFPQALRDVATTPNGGLLLAGYNSIAWSADPFSGEWVALIDDLPGVPERIEAADFDADGDTDFVVLFEDGSIVIWRDTPSAAERLSAPDSLVVSNLSLGDSLIVSLPLFHAGESMSMHVSLPPDTFDFPFHWQALDTLIDPGDSLILQLGFQATAEMDECYDGGEFPLAWAFDNCIGDEGDKPVTICITAGTAQAESSLDSLFVGESCGGSSGCVDELCTEAAFWLYNRGGALLRVTDMELAAHPDPEQSQPESFCLLSVAALTIDVGDSSLIELAFCPQMTEPWPWFQACQLMIHSATPAADSLLVIPVGGLLSCPWPPVFSGEIPWITEDTPGWVDLVDLISDPDDPIDDLQMRVLGVSGFGQLEPDSALRVLEQDLFRLNLAPGSHVNSELFPELGLDLELEDPSGNITRDTLQVRIIAVDDPPRLPLAPPAQLAVREGRDLQLLFEYAEVDGDQLAGRFELAEDESFSLLLEDLDPVGPDASFLFSMPLSDGDSLLHGGDLWWRFSLQDVDGIQGFSLVSQGEIALYSQRDSLFMVEDIPLFLDLAGWLLNPGEDASGWNANWLGVLSEGSTPPEQLCTVEQLSSMLFEISPGEDINSIREPALGLLFELEQGGSFVRRDTLALAIAAVDDAPRILEAPAAGLGIREGESGLLSWELGEVDGDTWAGTLALSRSPDFSLLIDTINLGVADPDASWLLAPLPGDSLRTGGHVYWRVTASDEAPGAGQLDAEGEVFILQGPQNLELSLVEAPPFEAARGDSLLLEALIRAETGYVGALELRLYQDQVRRDNISWEWQDLQAGDELSAGLRLVMPLDADESCWELRLVAANPAESASGNDLYGCITLGQALRGPEHRAFTPNGDGINDELEFLFGNQFAESQYRLELYDVNGRRVLGHTLTSGERSFRWNGRLDSEPLLPGVYIYIMLDGKTVLARGQVGLIR